MFKHSSSKSKSRSETFVSKEEAARRKLQMEEDMKDMEGDMEKSKR